MHTNVDYLSCGKVEAYFGYFQFADMRSDDRNYQNPKNQKTKKTQKTRKNSPQKKFLIFQEMELSSSNIKKILLFPEMKPCTFRP